MIESHHLVLEFRRIGRLKVRFRADGHGDVEGAANGHSKEVSRRDADDFHGFVVERQLLAKRLLAAELLLPEVITDHCAGQPTAAPIILRVEEPPRDRPDSEDVEELTAHVQPVHKTGIAARIAGELNVPPCGDSGKALMIFAQPLPDKIGYGRITADKTSARLAHIDDAYLQKLLWVLHRQRLQQYRIKKLENGRIGPDSQRECGNHHQRKARALGEEAQDIPHVIPKAFKPECNVFR